MQPVGGRAGRGLTNSMHGLAGRTGLGLVLAAVALLGAVSITTIALVARDSTSVSRDGRLVVRAAECEYRSGFKMLYDLIPGVVGDCLENEHHNPANGDGLQATRNGLLVWRKKDNWTAFTNGALTWINGPQGLQSRPNGERYPWESEVLQPPSPAPDAASAPLVQLAIDDAARRAGVDPSAVQVVGIEERDWSDASLGCPKPDQFYAQVITPGYLIVVEAAGQRFEYHTDTRSRVELC